MIGALWNGVSGVATQTVGINVESNNATNVNSIGHKSDSVTFEDLMYNGGYGSGVTTQLIRKDFDQGNIKITGVDYDAAIEGDGFFMVEESTTGNDYYTRAGNFKMNADGTLRTQFDDYVLGVPTLTSNTITSNPANTAFDTIHTEYISSQVMSSDDFLTSFNAKSTNYRETATTLGTSGDNYRTAGSVVTDIEALKADYQNKLNLFSTNPNAAATSSVAQESQLDFSSQVGNLNDSSDYVEVYIGSALIKQTFDTDAQTTMNLFADKLSKTEGLIANVDSFGVVTVNSLIPGEVVDFGSPSLSGQIISPTNTIDAVQGTGQGMVDSSRDALKAQIELAGGEFLEITNTIAYADEQSLTVSNLQLQLDQLGLSTDRFGDIEIDEGIIFSSQGDNKFLIGKLTTATFTNFSELNPEGNNQYSKTTASGDARYAGDINQITGGALELSNTDLSTELSDLLVYQKAFEASAKSITTADDFLKTAIELKK